MNIAQFIIDIAARGDAKTLSKVSSLQNGLDKADRAAGKLKRSLGQAFSSLPGAEFIMNPFVALTAGVGVVSKLGMETEKTAVSFGVLVGNEARAAKMLGEINQYADTTLWDRRTVQDATKTMLGFGVSAETVVDDLKNLGDIAAGDKEHFRSLALAFGQISALGRLNAQDLRQLIAAGYNPLQDVAAITGKTMEQVQEDMANGAISMDLVRQAFQRATGPAGRFNNMVGKLAQTSFGAFEQLKGKFIGALLEIYKVVEPVVIPVINVLGKGLEFISKAASWASDNLNTLLPVFGALTAAVAAYNVVTKAAAFATGVFSGVMKVLNIVMALNPVGLIVAGIAALVAAIVVCWNKFAGFRAVVLTVWDTMKGFGAILKNFVLDRITGIISGIGNLGLAISRLFKGDFAGAWETAKAGANQFLGVDAARNAATSARNLAGGIRDNYGSHLDSERAKSAAKDAITDPKAAAGAAGAVPSTNGAAAATPTAAATANAITTGGTRNTSIVLNIGKFFEDVVINNTNNTSMSELRDAVLESVNRSLEIAISAAR